MPSASNYTNKIRFAASVKNTKAQLVGGVGNLTQASIAGCGLNIQYDPIDYVQVCECSKNPPIAAPIIPPIIVPGPEWRIINIAGNGNYGYSGDTGAAISAELRSAHGIAIDSSGNMYIADTLNHCIRKVTVGGVISTIAGTGTLGYSGDTGAAISARLRYPYGVAVDSSGNVYIADTGNHRIRKVTGGVISTIVGTGTLGYSGDTGAAISAQLYSPYGIAVDSSGNMYIADSGNHRIRKVTGGVISTIAGTGTAGYSGDTGAAISARLNLPYGVAVDSSGNVYIADSENHCIRKVTVGGVISTIAGTGSLGYSGDTGLATSARLNIPYSTAVDSSGNVYIADSGNHRIRKVTGGVISTIAGTGVAGSAYGDGDLARYAELNYPENVAVDSSGNVYIADINNHRIRKLYYA
jgi:trimeric autotransporter adhesin